MEHTTSRPRKRIEPLRAWRAIRALIKDPDDTARVFDIIDALSGNSGERIFQRFRQSDTGARVLAERRVLLGTLDDHAALQALPPGTLGRVYVDFVTREQITGQGLADVSQATRRTDLDDERRLFGDRLRDMHDLWHVATGYGRDLIGEAALLAFSYAQTRNRGVGFIVAVAWLKAGGGAEGGAARRLIVEGYRRGRRAAWLPAQDWEALLSQPLASVRAQLGLGTPPEYAALRSAGAPSLA
ncbi:MAG: Coq4 family protein [Deltaproteobacteria bacterium]|nr:Coq4 family protein [Deltaproteobacteria bacterium]